MGKMTLPVLVDEVVPHKRPMSLLRHVVAHNSHTTICDVHIEANSLFNENGCVSSWVGLEYMAQAVAAHAGMKSRQRGESPEIGFWLGTRRAEFFTDRYRLGQTLHIAVRHIWGEGDLFSFDCSITDAGDGRQLAVAQLNVFRPSEAELVLSRRTK